MAGCADNLFMQRSFVLIATIIILVASAVVMYSRVRENGLSGAFRFGQDNKASATHQLMAAAAALQHTLEIGLSYSRTDLSRFGGVHFAFVSDSKYCIQVQRGEDWYHLLGPGGVPSSGTC